MEGLDMEIAVALFERGFSEARVEEALRHCSTLQSAIVWLTGVAEASPAKRVSSAKKAAATAPEPAAPLAQQPSPKKRGAAARKASDEVAPKLDSKQAAPEKPCTKLEPVQVSVPTIRVAAAVAPPALATAPAVVVVGGGASSTGSASGAAATSSSSSSSSAPLTTPIVVAAAPASSSEKVTVSLSVPAAGTAVTIKACDATNFWSKAAAIWAQKSAAGNGAGSQDESEEMDQEDDADEEDEEGETGEEEAEEEAKGEDDEAEADEGADAEGDGAEAGAADADADGGEPAVAEGTSPKRFFTDAEAAEFACMRPPATPCSVTRPKAADSADGDAKMFSPAPRSGGKRPPPTPGSSPRGMRLNNKEELCGICCNDVPPCRAVRLGCSHGWYCAQCVLRHAEARLATGASSITCPECCTPLAERDLRKLLPQELIDRLLSRSLEQAVSSAADLWACPTPNCPMRVALEDGELPRLKCTVCSKTSCLRCGVQPYHRGLTCEESRSKRGNATGKRKRDDGMEGLMKWIEETGAKQCPTCQMAVTKQNLTKQNTQYSECHKMCCRNCSTKFCFKCLAVLSDSFTCGCTINAHGFIDPHSGKRLNHLDRRKAKAKAKGKPKAAGRR
mmetsp:Transcript_79816/g.258624  ORF Transcript_79816/g.258624 Transcript_79816/m.258624 type:complete len:620 (-) Transcript_79816:106-1965(-)|eukprot:CAMPEP_0203881142 /NCGR_PEP_ID=MMETSP0359-20131031/25482_1 /ASSEMBLY_ACC=CAM_ASM_000338 /TAXON_ID=268821 /ORGANISM="Scrippsiella Hangoei, Strain SHTV-5" /LENGTH=619 /DNA_ID=CAMNT_0050800907 /DNA_START=88 /DNA_END=1947 /DNA_ORIENTATION=+